jgi:hypothetical protein
MGRTIPPMTPMLSERGVAIPRSCPTVGVRAFLTEMGGTGPTAAHRSCADAESFALKIEALDAR